MILKDRWWEAATLRTVLTEPRRHELVFAGHVVRLDASDFLSVAKFSAKFLDAVGVFPDFPEKGAGKFLREISAHWFSTREEIREAFEASDHGMLVTDVQTCLRCAPETETGADLERGAVILRGPAGALFLPRIVLERVRRACPVKFSPGDFYAALRTLRCEDQGPTRIDTWRGRAWLAPQSVFGHEPALSA